jgi:hypothetical protein
LFGKVGWLRDLDGDFFDWEVFRAWQTSTERDEPGVLQELRGAFEAGWVSSFAFDAEVVCGC